MLGRMALGLLLASALAGEAAAQAPGESKLDRAIREAAAKWLAKFDRLDQHLKKKPTAAQTGTARAGRPVDLGDLEWIDGSDDAVAEQRKPKSWWRKLGLPELRWPWGGRDEAAKAKSAAAPRTPAPGSEVTPIARRNSYIIQLKPDVADIERQLDALLQKYDLEIVNRLEGTGIIFVRQTKAPAVPPDAVNVRQLSEILHPEIVRKLRSESIVAAAAVNGVLAERGQPSTSAASAQDGQRKFDWSWDVGAKDDGNWGLKRMRMPAAWRILEHERAALRMPRPIITLLDSGFFNHPQLSIRFVGGEHATAKVGLACHGDHGTHVAGIVSAKGGSTGIDGIITGADVEAIGFAPQLTLAVRKSGFTTKAQHVAMFDDVLWQMWAAIRKRAQETTGRQVFNVSLAYNWRAADLERPDEDENIKLHVIQHGRMIKELMEPYKTQFLFVVAAGNDSVAGKPPVNASWASPFAWAGLQWSLWYYVPFVSSPTDSQSENIIVVEAFGRDGARAPFSNDQGHVSAPGVDIMSTSAIAWGGFAVCSGTSQAAPHVTGLAALLMELDPGKTPADIAKVIRDSATRAPSGGGAPHVDALEAISRLSEVKLRAIADLNRDGRIDGEDIKLFVSAMEQAYAEQRAGRQRAGGEAGKARSECAFPLADLNGSGIASLGAGDKRMFGGRLRSDAEVLQYAWTGDRNALQATLSALETRLAPRPGEPVADLACK